MKLTAIHDALFGVAVGDALGVPVEFYDRGELNRNPVKGMRAMGTHRQPAGTWSDDSSLTFCLAEMLCEKYSLQKLANLFVEWKNNNYWTPHGIVFDMGITTADAISALRLGCDPVFAGGADEQSNGNGSLMRILPIAFYVKDMSIEKRFDTIKNISSLTHAHIRSVIACFIYIEYALEILAGNDKWQSYRNMQFTVVNFLNQNPICSQTEMDKFERILQHTAHTENVPIETIAEDKIFSSGYVVHSLEAAFWCILNEETYAATVLKAVNLGSDTDTTAAIAGGIAGIMYGFETIPAEWTEALARRDDIMKLCDRLAKNLNG